MREITHKASQCLKNGQNFNLSNTSVYFLHGVWGMDLHGNHIASYNAEDKKLLIRDAGRESNTTKERLNGILTTFGVNGGIYQKNWRWYLDLNGKIEERTGEKIIELN